MLIRVELVNTGTELLLGDTINTNAAWIGQRLAALGVPPGWAPEAGFAVAIALTTYFSLVVGELVPKQLALRKAEPLAKGEALVLFTTGALSREALLAAAREIVVQKKNRAVSFWMAIIAHLPNPGNFRKCLLRRA